MKYQQIYPLVWMNLQISFNGFYNFDKLKSMLRVRKRFETQKRIIYKGKSFDSGNSDLFRNCTHTHT